MKTLIEWFEQVVRRLKHRRACKLEARDKEMAELRRWAMQEHQDHTDKCQQLIAVRTDLRKAKANARMLEEQVRVQATQLSEALGRVRQLEAELRESPMKAMVREIVREAMDRELQPGGKLWVSPNPIQYPHQPEGGYQEGRT